MPDASPISPVQAPALTESLAIDVAADVETWRLTVPAKPACYVLEEAARQPVMIGTVADLRHALVRRLGPPESDQPTGRIDYRAIVRHVRYRLVHSRFEANWAYFVNVMELFPADARRLLRRFHAHWIGIDLGEAHPRFVHRDQPVGPAATCFGPLPDSRTARRCIEVLEDLFDLCREHALLVQAPDAVACAYKQMGRCPAPCDGTITMDDYRRQLEAAAAFLGGDRQAWRERTTEAMKRAAKELNFELAARLKAQLDDAALFDSPATEHLRPLTDFHYVCLQPGPGKNHVRLFDITPAAIRHVGDVNVKKFDEQIAPVLAALETPISNERPRGTPLLALSAWHLNGGPREQGIFLHRSTCDADTLRDAANQLTKRKVEDEAAVELASDDA